MSFSRNQHTCNTTYIKSKFQDRVVRIFRPHHPLFGQTVGLIEVERHARQQYFIVELPNQSRMRIPAEWADNGQGPLPAQPTHSQILTIPGVRDLIAVLTCLEQKRLQHQATHVLPSSADPVKDQPLVTISEDNHATTISISKSEPIPPTEPAGLGSTAVGKPAAADDIAGAIAESGHIVKPGGSDR